jgi:hypothetical protein
MNTMTKKTKAVLAVASAGMLSVGGAAAFAYWTTTGTGTGSAAASAGGGTVTVHASFNAGLAPGQSSPVTYTADNGNDSNTVVNGLAATVSTNVPECLPAWFTVSANASGATVAAHAQGTQVGTGTLTFNDSTANQDACKGATITVNVTSN